MTSKSYPYFWSLTVLLSLTFQIVSGQNFTKLNNAPMTTKTGDYYSTSVIDIDNNYTLDVVVGYSNNGSHSLYINDGEGNFLDSSTKAVVSQSSAGFVSWGDYNNDCLPDVYWTTNLSNSPPFLANQGQRSFTINSTATPYTSQISSIGGAWADINGNGRLDLFVANMSNGAHHYYRNDGSGNFTKIDTGIFAQCTGNIQVVSFGDIENDGDADLFLGNYSGNNYLLINDGTGQFTCDTASIISKEGSFTSSGTWGDFDKDGYLDLLVTRFNAQNLMYHNNGDGTFSKVLSSPLISHDWKTYASTCGDLDNDGDLDIFLTTSGNGSPKPNRNVIFLNNGSGSFSKLTSGSVYSETYSSTGCAIVDLNNDGFQDILIANRNFAPISVFENDGNNNNYLKLGIFGSTANRLAVGTRVEITSTTAGKQVVYTGQQSRVSPSFQVHFGLAQDTIVDTLKIFWPGGGTCTLTNVSANSYYNIGQLTCSLDSIPTATYSDSTRFLAAHFKNQSDGAISSYEWDFGDGTTSTQTNPTHSYTQAGKYEITLKVFDNFCKSTTITDSIVICPDTARLGFTTFAQGQAVTFIDTSISNGHSFQWDYGDGNTDTGKSSLHNYAQAGLYNICLYVTDSCRIDTICRSIRVCADTVLANFGASSSALTLNLSDSSINAQNIVWDFGDGTTDTAANPSHTYTNPGYYLVCMTVSDSCATDSICKNIGICLDTAVANFQTVDTAFSVYFNSISRNANTYFWDFGDGYSSSNPNPTHTYQQSGTYTVCLTVSNDCYTDSLCKTVSVCLDSVISNFSYVDTTSTVHFTSGARNATSYLWDFGDGNSSSQQNPTYTYQQDGIYKVCLTVTNDCGSDSTCQTVIICPKVAHADYSNQHIAGFTMQFYEKSTNAVSFMWDFGDGNLSGKKNPMYAFRTAWYYNVCLTVTDSCGHSDSYCKIVNLTPFSIAELSLLEDVKVYPNPTNDFIHLELPSKEGIKAQVALYDLHGKVLYQNNGITETLTIDLNSHPKGIYILSIEINGVSRQMKISKS